MQIGIEILIVFFLVLFNGVLAGSEMAVVSARRVRLQQRAEAGDAGAKQALELARSPNRFLSTVQIGITLIGVLAGAFGGATLAQALARSLNDAGIAERYSEAVGVAIVVVCITYLSLIVGELVPKRLALQFPDKIASLISRPMGVLSAVMSPLVWFLGKSTDVVLAVLRIPPHTEVAVSEEEIRMIIKESTEAGVLEPAEHEIIRSALRLGDRTVASLMVPRRDVAWLDLEEPPEAMWREVTENAHSRFPVCKGDVDTVSGVVSVRDLWLQSAGGGPIDLQAALRRPLFIPESLNVLQALEQFRQERTTLAIVVDEYGGTAGLVSLKDILEEIVGALPSLEDVDEPGVVQRSEGSWLVDASLNIEKLVDLLDLKNMPEDEEYHTLAGFMLFLFGRVPLTAEAIAWGGYNFEVVDMDGTRIDKVMISRVGP